MISRKFMGWLCCAGLIFAAGRAFSDCDLHPPAAATLTVVSCRSIDPAQEKKLQTWAERYPLGFVESSREQMAEEARQMVEAYRGAVVEATAEGEGLNRYFYPSKDAQVCQQFGPGAVLHVEVGGACCDGDPNPPCFLGIRHYITPLGITKNAGGVKIIDASVDPKYFAPEVKKLFIDSGTENIPPPCPEGTHVEGDYCRKGPAL